MYALAVSISLLSISACSTKSWTSSTVGIILFEKCDSISFTTFGVIFAAIFGSFFVAMSAFEIAVWIFSAENGSMVPSRFFMRVIFAIFFTGFSS